LNFGVARSAGGWQIQLPTSRLDVEREIDLIEEIARHYGYDKFASVLPPWTGSSKRQSDSVKEQTLKRTLLGLGYSESLTYAFVAAAETLKFSAVPPVRLKNPLSLETEVMRTSLVPGLLASLLRNYHRGTRSVRLYELGRIYVLNRTPVKIEQVPMQFIQALQRAGKSFDVQVGPDQGHSGVNRERMMEFFIERMNVK